MITKHPYMGNYAVSMPLADWYNLLAVQVTIIAGKAIVAGT